MWFDVQAALAELGAEVGSEAPPSRTRVVDVADVAGPPGREPQLDNAEDGAGTADVLDAVRDGAKRPGPVAVKAGIGTTVTYRLIDRLIADGRLSVSRDGALSMGARPEDD